MSQILHKKYTINHIIAQSDEVNNATAIVAAVFVFIIAVDAATATAAAVLVIILFANQCWGQLFVACCGGCFVVEKTQHLMCYLSMPIVN